MSNHQHRWVYGPTMDTNPPSEYRTCPECGRRETRNGVGVAADGSRIEATPWTSDGRAQDAA